MAKWLLLAVVVGVALWWWRSAQVRRGTPPSAPPRGPSGPQAMVRCAHCQLLLPQAEAFAESDPGAAERHYCSESHRRAGPKRG